MSAFRKDFENKIKESIKYFNTLDSQMQAYVCANFLTLDEKDEEKLFNLFFAINNDISNYDQTTLSNKLFDLGLEKTYAFLLVQNIIDQAPPLQYQLKELEKFEDEDFKTKFPAIFNEMWVEQKPHKILIREQNLTSQQLQTISNLTRKLMSDLARSVTSEKKLRNECISAKLSKSKTDTFLNTLKVNSEFWKNLLVFSNTQDNFFSSQDIRQQNDLILRSLHEILNLIKNQNGLNNRNIQ